MYKLLFENFPLYDPRGANKTDRLIIREPSVHIGVNMAGTVSFVIDPGHPNADKITKMSGTLELQDDTGPIFRGRVLDSRETFYKSTQYTAEGAMAYLNDSIVEPYDFPADFLNDPGYIAAAASGNVVAWWLGWLLDNHNRQVSPERQIKLGTVTVTDPNNYISRADSTYPTTFDVIREKLVGSRLGGYLIMRYERDGNYLDYISTFVQTNAQEITFTQNLLDLVRERSAADLYTAVLPVGDEGLTIESLPDGPQENGLIKAGKIIYNPQAEADYGGRITRKVEYDDITLPQNLLHSAVMDMGGEIRLPESLEVRACDLHNLDGQTPSFRIGLYTVVVSTPHEIRKSYPLTELQPNILEPGATTITLNGTTTQLTSQLRRQQSTIVEGAIPYIQKAVQSATEQITGNRGGYVVWHSTTPGGVPEEILIMDTPDIKTATKVWRWNKAGLGYSSTGYNGPYGTAITQDGAIVADFITTGQLTASIIKSGILQSLDGDVFYLDLEKGVLKMRAESLTIGGKTVEEISSEKATGALNDFVNVTFDPKIGELQKQIDGQIENFFRDYEPTLDNEPASLWTTDAEKLRHEGDMFYWKSKGYGYRFMPDDAGGWEWVLIQDTDITKALAEAALAKDTADGKRRTYLTQPVPPYDEGDVWFRGPEFPALVCIKSRTSGSFDPDEWAKEDNYIDLLAAQEAATGAVNAQTQQQIFDKLTGGGSNQGIYLQNGRVYINATYIQSGTISLELLKLVGTACGLMQGYGRTVSGRTTEGIVIYANGVDSYGDARPPYLILTDAGFRVQVTDSYQFNFAGGSLEVLGDIYTTATGNKAGMITAASSISAGGRVTGLNFYLSGGHLLAQWNANDVLQIGGTGGTYIGGNPVYVGQSTTTVYIRGSVNFSQATSISGVNDLTVADLHFNLRNGYTYNMTDCDWVSVGGYWVLAHNPPY